MESIPHGLTQVSGMPAPVRPYPPAFDPHLRFDAGQLLPVGGVTRSAVF